MVFLPYYFISVLGGLLIDVQFVATVGTELQFVVTVGTGCQIGEGEGEAEIELDGETEDEMELEIEEDGLTDDDGEIEAEIELEILDEIELLTELLTEADGLTDELTELEIELEIEISLAIPHPDKQLFPPSLVLYPVPAGLGKSVAKDNDLYLLVAVPALSFLTRFALELNANQ